MKLENGLKIDRDRFFGKESKVESKFKEITLRWVIESVVIAIVFYLFSVSNIASAPLALGLLLAFIICDSKVIVAGAMYIITSLIMNYTYVNCMCEVITGLSIVLILLCKTKQMKYVAKVIITLCNLAIAAYLMSYNGQNPLDIAVGIVFAMLLCYVATLAIRPILTNKLLYKLVDAELICTGILLVVCGNGLASLEINGFYIIMFVAVFAICVTNYVGGRGGLVVGICLGAGQSLLTLDPTLIAGYAIVALLISAFSSAPRILMSLSGVLGYVMFRYYLNVDYSNALNDIILMTCASACFSVIPKKFFDSTRQMFNSSYSRLSSRHMVNRNRQDISTRLNQAGEIFYQMSGILSEISVGDGTKQQAIFKIADRLAETCNNCPNYTFCTNNAGYKNAFLSIAEKAIAKEKITMLDLPQMIVDDCRRMTNIIANSSEYADDYRRQVFVRNSEDIARGIVADQLSGVGHVLESYSSSIGKPIRYNGNLEKKVLEILTYSGILCSEVMITDNEDISATIVVSLDSCDKAKIEKLMSRALNKPMKCEKMDNTVLSGWNILYLECQPKYEVVFGSANCSKTKNVVSGDTHSFIKVSHNKFMMALCDGMGSGRDAHKISDTAISLVENFYKAGFDNQTVLRSVNKFLALSCGESFSAVDICVINLDNGECDIIKIGSPDSYIKTKETTSIVQGGALPLGVLEEMRPKVNNIQLSGGEMIMLATDGITDCFENDDLPTYINNINTVNPQTLASTTLEQAMARVCNNPKDDMTVCTARVFERKVG